MTSKTEREKQQDEVREQQEQNAIRRLTYAPAEVHVDVPATSASGEDDKDVEIHVFGGHAYVSTHGEARFDREQLVTLIQALQKAFQAVQV